jgi:hypothetical protein
MLGTMGYGHPASVCKWRTQCVGHQRVAGETSWLTCRTGNGGAIPPAVKQFISTAERPGHVVRQWQNCCTVNAIPQLV